MPRHLLLYEDSPMFTGTFQSNTRNKIDEVAEKSPQQQVKVTQQ